MERIRRLQYGMLVVVCLTGGVVIWSLAPQILLAFVVLILLAGAGLFGLYMLSIYAIVKGGPLGQ